MDKYTVPPYTPEDDASPDFDPGMIPHDDIGGEKAAKAAIRKASTKNDCVEKRVHGGTKNYQKQGWIKGR